MALKQLLSTEAVIRLIAASVNESPRESRNACGFIISPGDNAVMFIRDYLFIYGTLRNELHASQRRALMQCCDYLETGYMRGKLYDMGGYPGAVESTNANDRIIGEIYKVHNGDELWPRLDTYEECDSRFPEPHEYIRKRVQVYTKKGERIAAWMYLYNRDISSLKRIASGDYVRSVRGAS